MAKDFSNIVLAKTFPIVFNKNIKNKNHKAILTAPKALGKFNLPDFTRTIRMHKTIIRIEKISKLKSFSAVSKRPPQRKSTGAKSKKRTPTIIDK